MVQARLLEAAIREFGEKGLEGASTRGIAGAAGTAMSSITYHYGSKEGLYLATADHLAGQMAQEMLPLLDRDDTAALHEPAAARAKIRRILIGIAERMMGEESSAWAMFVVREQLHPGAAFDRLYETVMRHVLNDLAALVAAATGLPNDARTRLAAFLMAAQVFSLRSARGTLLRAAREDSLSGPTKESLTTLISLSMDAMLDRLGAERQETA